MASRYTQEYLFQHSLMNISFRNLNEIIHPNAENIPQYIHHFASSVFIKGDFWNNNHKILEELQLEAHRQDYIQSYISYVNMQRTTYNLVTKGKFLVLNTLIYQISYTQIWQMHICKSHSFK